TLADSNTYNIVFRGIDRVGNIGSDTIKFVTYDTFKPKADVEYETEFITSLEPVTGTTINVTFDELQNTLNGVPKLRLFFDGQEAQNDPESDWDGSFDLSTNPDTVSSLKKFTVDMINSVDDAKTWYYVVDMVGNPTIVPADSDWDGYLWAEVVSGDLSGNPFTQDSLSFTNYAYLDNTVPTATFTYTNQRDSLLTYPAPAADTTYCCYAIGGDQITVQVAMNEEIKGINPVPLLSGTYNKDNDGVGTVFSDIAPSSSNLNEETEFADMLTYTITIEDSVFNDGPMELNLTAFDRSGTQVSLYADSPQKLNAVGSNIALEIDNIHPWGYTSVYPIFEEPQPEEITFPTDTLWTTGYRVVDGWINSMTDSVKVKVPYQQPTTDRTLFGNATWGPIGALDIQVKNLDIIPVQWQNIGEPDNLTSGIDPLGEYAYLRTVSRSIDLLDTASYSVGNRLLFRAALTDKHGNVTFGQMSDKYVRNDRDLYEPDSINADTVGYDIIVPDLGAYNAGNFNEAGPIVSNDTVTISWSEFTDPGGILASGVDRYELQIYEYADTSYHDLGSIPVPGDSAHTDSVFTGDNDGDGVNDVWLTIPIANAPNAGNPFQQDTTMLKHNHYYAIGVRAFDVAGNSSDTLYTDPIQRINSAPEFISLNDLILYEDIPWDYDTARVTDPDLSTLQSDSFSYSIMSWTGTESDTTGNKVESNPPAVDEVTGLISWTPIQNDTIDQAGVYTLRLVVEDQYSFSATMFANATVNAVNDTPEVAIIGQDEVITWSEDKPTTEVKMINLSKYVKDVDNADSTLSWQFVIMDTSQLDEDFPLATVIVGPGTPKKVQTQLMRAYMGFNPARGVDIPALARRSGRTTMRMLSRENSLITIDIETTNDSTYAIFNSDSNYYGSNHRIIFRAQDPLGAFDVDTVIVNITPLNDPPIVSAIDTLLINENDSIWIDFSQYTSDVDDSTLTFTIEGIFNTDSVTFSADPYLSHGSGYTVLFNPFDLWSGHANFRVTASDEEAQSSQVFTLNVLRVPRPDIEVSLVQNNAFSSYVHIIIVDKEEKTKYLQLEVQNQRIDVDTVAAYTYTGDFSFGIGGGYSFDVLAIAEVGKTIYTNTFNLAPARVANRWYASSSDGRFSITGDPGSVDMDQSFLIVDSSLFVSNFTDEASYVLGDESFVFNKPIEVQFGSMRDDLSIYQRDNGVIWKELPSINRNGQVFTFTENTGYFRLGPKTIIVPEETDLHQNYPNPFNPSTTIKYDIGLLDGLEQKVSVSVYNIIGQHVATLVNNDSQVGQFYVKWDGADKFGKMLPSGIYFVQLRTDTGIIKNKKMMFLK
ncbi:MAG: FlgD immunoglobulin-like domain containing protein, partial [Candidatus Neomarinimicrobiota bacterium]|nr:FlgD immunoglobulin-like domain containing protein [Candidatus Neomarinimicrobiota bacterium]